MHPVRNSRCSGGHHLGEQKKEGVAGKMLPKTSAPALWKGLRKEVSFQLKQENDWKGASPYLSLAFMAGSLSSLSVLSTAAHELPSTTRNPAVVGFPKHQWACCASGLQAARELTCGGNGEPLSPAWLPEPFPNSASSPWLSSTRPCGDEKQDSRAECLGSNSSLPLCQSPAPGVWASCETSSLCG